MLFNSNKKALPKYGRAFPDIAHLVNLSYQKRCIFILLLRNQHR